MIYGRVLDQDSSGIAALHGDAHSKLVTPGVKKSIEALQIARHKFELAHFYACSERGTILRKRGSLSPHGIEMSTTSLARRPPHRF